MRFEIRVFVDHLDVIHVAANPSEFLQTMCKEITRANYPLESTFHVQGSLYISTWTFPGKSWDQALARVVNALRHHGMDLVVVDGTTAPLLQQPGDA